MAPPHDMHEIVVSAVQRRLLVVAIFLTAVIDVWMLIAVPRYQVTGVAFDETVTPKQRAELINEYRKTLTQIVGGVFVVIGAVSGAFFTWTQIRVNRDQIRVNREGQFTDRFMKAIAQLGDSKLAVRLGGIYSLERLARDSEKDHWTVIETLAAFIRDYQPSDYKPSYEPLPTDYPPPERVQLPTDIKAAATVIARRPRRVELSRVDLTGAHLEGTNLTGAHLKRANLYGAHLERATLIEAHLEGADLSGAHLEGASFYGAHLEGANLWEAHLAGADFTGAEGVDPTGAHFESADLKKTPPPESA